MRADTPVMLAGVASYPHTVDEVKASPELQAEYKEWQQDVLKFLQKKYGKSLLSVVEHTDEPHPHLHFYAVPEAGKGFNAKNLHDGFKAGFEAKKDAKLQRELYNNAMRGLQDAYHAEVGVKHGQARLGPRRRRLTRAEWVRDQLIMTNAAKALREVQSRAERVLGKAKKQAASIVNEAREQAERGGLKLGAFFDGLRGNAKALLERIERERDQERAKRKKAEAEKEKTAQELVHERMIKDETLERLVDMKTKPLRSELSAEQKKRQELEKQLDSLSSENQTLKQQLKPEKPETK